LGRTGGDELTVEGQFSVSLDELRAAWSATLPSALG
jgi:phosphoribosylformylglycinamidine synthase subunit PurL